MAIHKDCKETDRYEIIIDGTWCRYADSLDEATAYGAKNGNATVIDMTTGKVVGKWY